MNSTARNKPADVRQRILKNSEWKNGCLEWRRKILKGTGYGEISVFGKGRPVHRVQYALEKGPVAGLMVLHKCDNRRCINPDHLFLGTHTDNMQDKMKKGRHFYTYGTLGYGKLRAEQVLQIKELGRSKSLTYQKIADKFGISLAQVSRIINGKRWGNLESASKAGPGIS